MGVSSPIQKLHRIQILNLWWRIKKACWVKELQSLHGYLQEAAKVVPTGRPFICRITDILRLPAAASPKAFIRLNAGFLSDIKWWCQFLPGRNGKSILPPAPATPHATITSDASGNRGCSAFSGSNWFQIRWPSSWKQIDITAKELLPIIMALAIWGKHWLGRTVLIRTNNMAVVHILNSGSARNKDVMHLLHSFFFILAQWSISITPQHLPGCHNQVADALSRNELSLFHSLSPHKSAHPTPIPPSYRTSSSPTVKTGQSNTG